MSDLTSVTVGSFLAVRSLGVGSLDALRSALEFAVDVGLTAQDSDLVGSAHTRELELGDVEQWLDAAVTHLPDRSRDILSRRWCLGGNTWATLADLGIEHGVSRERIRQIHSQAKTRLRRHLRAEQLHEELRAVLESNAGARADRDSSSRGWRVVASEIWPGCVESEVAAFLFGLVHGGQATAMERWQLLEAAYATEVEEAALRARKRSRDARNQAALNRRVERLLAGVWWPPSRRTDLPPFDRPPVRDVRQDGLGHATTWLSAKAGREVQCESGLEAALFELCEAADSVEWFTEQPIAIDYRFAGAPHSYVPDVLLRLVTGEYVLVEAKPPAFMTDARNLAKWDAAQEWCAARGVGFLVCTDRQPASEVYGRTVDPRFEQLVLRALDLRSGAIDWDAFTAIRDATGSSTLDLVALAARRGLELHRQPWSLRRRSEVLT